MNFVLGKPRVFLATFDIAENVQVCRDRGVFGLGAGADEQRNSIGHKFLDLLPMDLVVVRLRSLVEEVFQIRAVLRVAGISRDVRSSYQKIHELADPPGAPFWPDETRSNTIIYPFRVRCEDMTAACTREVKDRPYSRMANIFYNKEGEPIGKGWEKKCAGNFVNNACELQNLKSILGLELFDCVHYRED